MNTEAMPLKPHDHYQQQCGANPPIEEKAPFLATTTTTKTRVTRAALVLCMVAAVVYSKHFKRGRFLQSYDPELVAADGVLRESSSTTETGNANRPALKGQALTCPSKEAMLQDNSNCCQYVADDKIETSCMYPASGTQCDCAGQNNDAGVSYCATFGWNCRTVMSSF